jgi:hypothetical protein
MVGEVMPVKKWKRSKDPLFRGDHRDAVSVPNPVADGSVVRHVMYFEGPGRETPYLSTSERRDVAERFAQAGGVWEVSVPDAIANGVGHISNSELLGLMTGNGKGVAKWPDPFEVMQARRYVEEHNEHLLDFRNIVEPVATVRKIFSKS